MAEGDEPYFAGLPPELTKLVPIAHPQYPKIADLDLKWCGFPALSRLGFDIGGVQYTASPFIGWFMDAEIGVRNLADTFRYNVLPDVAKAIGWSSPNHAVDELPDHERLLWLSRAQTELNYAVHCSFQKAGVTCTSSLTASNSWTTFDDQHLREKGYRLNADPYWISPPQGSIVPIWHRGGAPNYQPKPLIARHKYDPVKVWKRRNSARAWTEGQLDGAETVKAPLAVSTSKVHIFYCGTSGMAATLAEKLRLLLAKRSSEAVSEFGSLNSFNPGNILPNETMLLIVATTGKGEVPSNGQQFMKKMADPAIRVLSSKYSIFGIGDSGYHQTFNWACKAVHQLLKERQFVPLMLDCVAESDVSVENPPWIEFRAWWGRVETALDGKPEGTRIGLEDPEQFSSPQEKQQSILQAYREATVHFDPLDHQPDEILKLSLEIPEVEYETMGHIRLLPRNSEAAVERAMYLLKISNHETIGTVSQKYPTELGEKLDESPHALQFRAVPVRRFLSEFVDLHSPFLSMDWAPELSIVNNQPAIQVLEHLSQHQLTFMSLRHILFSMAPLHPRSYSIASSPEKSSDAISRKTILDVLVRVIPDGRFSHRCLSEVGDRGKVLYKLTSNKICLPLMDLKGRPVIAVGCGTGIAPVRSLLQYLIHTNTQTKMSLFIGFRPGKNGAKLFASMAEQASRNENVDIVYSVPSNEKKVRVQDYFVDCAEVLKRKMGDEGGYFYVCGNAAVVKGVKEKLEFVLGSEIWTTAQERILEETF